MVQLLCFFLSRLTGELGDGTPTPDPESCNVIEELLIFFRGPQTFAEFRLQATRIASHQKFKEKQRMKEFDLVFQVNRRERERERVGDLLRKGCELKWNHIYIYNLKKKKNKLAKSLNSNLIIYGLKIILRVEVRSLITETKKQSSGFYANPSLTFVHCHTLVSFLRYLFPSPNVFSLPLLNYFLSNYT